MAIVVQFPRHARTSSKSASLRAAKLAKASKFTSDFPRSAAKRTTPGQWGLGMPRDRQPLTVLSDCESAPATSPVPPQASTIASHVKSIPTDIVRNLRTCQGFATCETTFRGLHDEISTMGSDEEIGRRLIAVREHFKRNQTEFADDLHIAKNTLNGYERGSRRLTIETASRIRDRYGVSVDWLLFGDVSQPSHDLAVKLGPKPKIDADTKKPKPIKKRRRAS